jgi:WD40 repeat protein
MGDRYAVSSKNVSDEEAITVYETSTGLPISKISASTRKGASCSPMSGDEGQFRWLSDGKRLVRKIDNAVQVLDVATGSVLNEISFDDSAMGSPHAPPDDNRCLFVMAWASDGSHFATLGASIEVRDHPTFNGLKVWDAASSKLITEKRPGVRYPSSITFSPDGQKILVTGSNPMIIDAQTGQTLQELNTCPICQTASQYPLDIR